MWKIILGAAAAASLMAGAASAQTTCTNWPQPYPQNGQTADAAQLMGVFNYLAGCAAPQASPHFTGNVGVGTASPMFPITVWSSTYGQGSFVGANGNPGGVTIDNAGGGHQSFLTFGDNGAGKWQIGKQVDNSFFEYDVATSRIFLGVNTSGMLQLGENSQISIPSGGYVGIGTTAPAYALDVNGYLRATNVAVTSDARLKKDVVQISGALGLVERLRGVRYSWRPTNERDVGKALSLPLDEPQIGFLAQEVEKVIPEAVQAPRPGGDEVYTLKETKLIPIVVEALKEQEVQFEKERAETRAILNQQQAQIDRLVAAIAALKQSR